MRTDLPQSVLDAADITAVSQLVLIERESRDLGRWDQMRDCFHADSLVRLSWFTGTGPDFVRGSIDMARRNVLAKHRLGPVLVRLAGNRAVASLSAIIDIPAMLSGVEVQLSSYARFLYRIERRAERWRIFGFDAIYLRDELTTAIPGLSLPVTLADVAGFRPSYRMLSYLLTSQGYDVNPNLPGEDRPETTAALNRELYGWAGIQM
jgi:SnoaL-like domain